MALPIVVLDPGHGGKDPGAVGFELAEKDVVLRLALMVRDELLSGWQVDVRLTRDSDVFVGLSDRAAFANRLGASLFVSLHCNAGGGTGFESYIHPAAKPATANIQQVIHGEVMAYLRKHGVRDRGMKKANLAVCRETKMPAVLLECLFIDTLHDNRLLRDESFLRGLAKAIASGIAKVLGLKVKAKPAPKPAAATKPGVLYKVQVGAFANRENAEKLVAELRAKGYNPIIITDGGAK